MGTWRTGTPMPTPADNFGCAAVKHSIYCIGGYVCPSGTSSGKAADIVQIYNTTTNTWRYGATKPTKASFIGCASVGSRVYCFGGLDNTTPQKHPTSDTLEIYDTEADVWSTGASMPKELFRLVCIPVGDRIYCFGGYHYADLTFSDSVLIYDSSSDTWSEGEPSPFEFAVSKGAMVGDRIYIPLAGGQFANGSSTTLIYDISLDSWSYGAALPENAQYYACTAYRDEIYCTTGVRNSDNIYVYDPVRNIWRLEDKLPTKREMLRAVTVDNDLYFIGGRIAGACANFVEIYTPDDIPVTPPDPDEKCCCTRVKLQIETCSCNNALLDDLNIALKKDGARTCRREDRCGTHC